MSPLRRAGLLLAMAVAGGAACAEAPEQALRPEARPGGSPEVGAAAPPLRPEARPLTEAAGETAPIRPEVRADEAGPEAEELEAPGRPEPRPAGQVAPLEIVVGPGGAVAAPLAPPNVIPSVAPVTEPEPDFLPAVPRQPPVLETSPEVPPLEGPAGVVRAELMMQGPVAPRVVVDGWDGSAPPARPGAEPLPGEPTPPMRPRERPRPPQDPEAMPPPEPDAPPAYAPGARIAVLPEGPGYSPLAVARALIPPGRPEGIVARAEAARVAAARGQVCGNPLIQGEVAGPVRDGGGCGIEEPVRVRSVDGVRLSEAALMDCTTAEALLDWVQEGARPALEGRGGGLAGLEVMGHYACRPRNNQAGARLSEHGRGRAIDIGAVVLRDGSRLSVARDWPDADLREMHAAACGIFSTTLGPGSDGFHEDHLHYDTARGRGPYCR